MASGDLAMTLRRVRRGGSKKLDLSHRGLSAWPEEIFALKQITVLDLSGNELSTVDSSLSKLENLEDLNLSNNRISDLSALEAAVAGLQQLQTLMLDGNPIGSLLTAAMVQQLAKPPIVVGKMPGQVILEILRQGVEKAPAAALAPDAAPARRSPQPPSALQPGAEDRSDSPGDDAGSRRRPVRAGTMPMPGRVNLAATLPAAAPAATLQEAPSQLAGPAAAQAEADAAAWRRERAQLAKQIEELQAKVKDLEEEVEDSKASRGSGGSPSPDSAADASSKPSWLQSGSKGKLSSTLPSRGGDEDADELRTQLRERDRKIKRLQGDVQRLSDRAQERDMHSGGVGSVPHFEWNEEVELGAQISQGGFSIVHKGTWHGTTVAIKKLFDPKITEELLAEFDNEVQKLEQLRHPNILLLLAVHRKPPELAFITEMVEGGSMFQLLHSPEKFNCADGPIEEASLQLSMDILETTAVAIAYMHARGMTHRDIKTQNVLLSPKMEVKLCDFGLTRMKSELMTGAMQFAGTPNYMAPEIFRNQKYSENVDVFAFGTMLWEAAALDIPWCNFDGADIRDRVLKGRMLDLPRGLPLELQRMIQDCWIADRTARPSMAAVLPRLRDCPRERHLSRAAGGGATREGEATIRPTAFAAPTGVAAPSATRKAPAATRMAAHSDN